MTTNTSQGWVNPIARIKRRVGWRDAVGGQPQNGVEGRHWVEAPVEAEDVFVEVGLQMVLGDGSVVRAENPGL